MTQALPASTSPLTTCTSTAGSGDGAGPETFSPDRSNTDPWHGHFSFSPSGATVQPWCVQIADSATTVPAVGCVRMIGFPSGPVAASAPPSGMSDSFASGPPDPAPGVLSDPELASD